MKWTLPFGSLLSILLLSCSDDQAISRLTAEAQEACPASPLPPSGMGRKIHVSTTGDDWTADGSSVKPFATLKRASELAQAGDTVIVRGGTYALKNEQFITTRGKPAAWVTIRAAEGEKVVFDATGASLPDLYRGIITFGGAYVIFDGFEILNSPGSGIKFYQANNILVRNSIVHDVQGLAIGGSGHSITIQNNEVYRAVLSNQNGAKDVGGGWLPAVASGHFDSPLMRSKNWLVENNYFHDSWGECLDALYLEDSIFRGNRIHDCYSTNIYLDNASRIQVVNNLSYVTTDRYNTVVNPHRAHGITFASESRDGDLNCQTVQDQKRCLMEAIEIKGNRITGTHNGLLFFDTRDGGYRDITIAENVIWNQRREAVWIAPTAYAMGSNSLTGNVLYPGMETGSFGLGNSATWQALDNSWSTQPAPELGAGCYSAHP